MSFFDAPKYFQKTVLVAVALCFASVFVAPKTEAAVILENKSAKGSLGVIKGTVRDESGNPIADAYVSFFRVGTDRLLKQVRSSANGSFLAKVLPGTYTVLAVAQGYNPISYRSVEISRSTELNYKFNLERSGSGNTLPERRVDRNSPKWRIRAAQINASIYQNQEGEFPIDETAATVSSDESAPDNESANVDETDVSGEEQDTGDKRQRPGQTVIETFGATANGESFVGTNFATLLSVTDQTQVVIAGQIAASNSAPQRFEARVSSRLNEDHLLRVNASLAKIGRVELGEREKSLGQFSFQAVDEWRVKNNLVVVLGFDYSRFLGAGNEFSLSPRLGVQFDVNARTRFRGAFTTQNESRTWSQAIDLEGTPVLFREPFSMPDIVVEDEKPKLNRSSRFEFGVERVLDDRSSIEANVFFDLTSGRGVGLINMPIGFLGGEADKFVANQQGRAQGLRLVYARRISQIFTASAGYSIGNGQKLSENAISNPANVFEDDYFQTIFGQVVADLKSGTQVRTVFRLSPQATVFSIDPFQGRMTIYDPGLSVVVTQALPNLGLPFRAEAIIDARNLLDVQNGVNSDEGSLRLTSQRRILRGGIMVRF